MYSKYTLNVVKSGSMMNDKNWFSGWISGLVDGEGSFNIEAQRFKKMKAGIYFRPCFSVSIHKKDKNILETLKKYFDEGCIVKNKARGHYIFQINSLGGCLKLIDFFDKNILLTTKRKDFLIWKKAVLMKKRGEDRNTEGLLKMLDAREKINVHTQCKKRISKEEIAKGINKFNDLIKEKIIIRRKKSYKI